MSSFEPLELSEAAKKLGDALASPAEQVKFMSRVGVDFGAGPLGWWRSVRIKFWYFVGNQRRAQKIILDHLSEIYNA